MNTSFKEIIDHILDKKINLPISLPVCHTSDMRSFMDFLMPEPRVKGVIPCNYYSGEKLAFYFYGKASYIPNGDQKDSYKNNPPVTLIFGEDFFQNSIKRLVCFDSGCFIGGRIHENYKGKTELLETYYTYQNPSVSHIKAGIVAVYSSNENYLLNKFEPHFNSIVNKCLFTIQKMYEDKFYSTDYGPQGFTYEIQIEDLEINNTPIAIAIPINFYSANTNTDEFKNIFPNVEVLNFRSGGTIFTSYAYMRDKVEEYVQQIIKK